MSESRANPVPITHELGWAGVPGAGKAGVPGAGAAGKFSVMDSTTDQDALLDALDRALVGWLETESFAHAVAETVQQNGYAKADVEAQLKHVVLRSRGRTMRVVLQEELGERADLSQAPETVLVLASARVPGLVIEGIAAAVAIGARALVRPSRDETVLHHLLGGLRAFEPELMEHVEVISSGSDIPWERAQSAMVFGSDETIAYVQDQLSAAAASRVAGYGSRQAIAVAMPGADIDESWAERLADDVLMFRQAGCMSPQWLFVVGSEADTAPLVEQVGQHLATARGLHVAPGVEDGLPQRRATDSDVLGAIAAGLAPDPTVLYAGNARLTVVRVADVDELAAQVAQLGSLLQTAVIATSREDRADVAQRLLDAGVTRICLPGQAHEPEPLWPQDGIGRIAPLLA